MPSPPLLSSPTSIQILIKRQHGRRSHQYGMSRVKLRGHQPIHRLQTTHRRNNISSSIIQRAHITAEAVAVKAKRATDRVVTVTITSTQVGASKVRLDFWVSQVQAKWQVQTRSVSWLPSRQAVYGTVEHFAQFGILYLGGFFASYLLSSTASSAYPPHGGRAFLFFRLG